MAFGAFPLFLPLAITAFGGPEGYFGLAITAFGAFGFSVPKYYYRLGKMDKRSLDSLVKEVAVFKVFLAKCRVPSKNYRIKLPGDTKRENGPLRQSGKWDHQGGKTAHYHWGRKHYLINLRQI